MIKGEVNVVELKSKLSEYLRSVRNGNEIIIKDRNTPIAKLVSAVSGAKRASNYPPGDALAEGHR
jgi:prevent-host-death family protein